MAAAVVPLSYLHECLAFRWRVWPRVGPGISEGDQEDQENAIIRWYFRAAYGSCWSWWKDQLGDATTRSNCCRSVHSLSPSALPPSLSHQGHLVPAPASSADMGTSVTAILLILKTGGIYCSLEKSRWETYFYKITSYKKTCTYPLCFPGYWKRIHECFLLGKAECGPTTAWE